MAAELVINSGTQSAMPAALMLLLSLFVSTLASYVALDLARPDAERKGQGCAEQPEGAGAGAQDPDAARQIERHIGRQRADREAEQKHECRRHRRLHSGIDHQLGCHAPFTREKKRPSGSEFVTRRRTCISTRGGGT